MANRRRNNSTETTSGRHPVYHGIRMRAGKWVSEIREPNKTTRIWLGTYPTPEMAAAAYDVASLALKGTYATLNFPESVFSHTIHENPTSDDIRAAAANAAAARAPSNESGRGSSTMTNIATHHGEYNQYMNDEALFGMPNMLSDIAQGMLLSPPRVNYSQPDDGTSYYTGGGNLWDY